MSQPNQPPDGDPLLKAFTEIADTLRDDPAFSEVAADRQPQLNPHAQEHEAIVARCDTVYLQFRGDRLPTPIARTPEELQAAIELRCKTGLAALLQQHGDNPAVEYAGYTLIPYRYPTDRFDVVDPEAAKALRESMLGPAADIQNNPDATKQDYYLESTYCFDIRALSELYPAVWQFGANPQENFSQRGYILGPVVRTESDSGGPDIDDYNQYDTMTFDPGSAVLIPGDVLLKMLREHYPRLLLGGGVRGGLAHAFLAEKYGLDAANERFHHNWIIRRQVWEAEHGENPGEE